MVKFENLNIASYVFLGLFILASIIQLIFAFLEKEKYRRIEKPFLLLFLSLFAVVTFPNHPFIYVATICGLLGDIFVILKPKRFLYFGALAFFLGFVFYALEALLFILNGNVSWIMWVVIGVYYAAMMIFIIFTIGKRLVHKNRDLVGLGLYLSALLTLLPILVYTTSQYGHAMFLAIIGNVFFIFSDFTIVYTKFVKKFKRYDFYVMLTYLLAQALIVLGFILSI